jgi:hypothetical protein
MQLIYRILSLIHVLFTVFYLLMYFVVIVVIMQKSMFGIQNHVL